jgi:hypothetical protein
LGEFFFAFVLLEMIEISQGFKTFEFIYNLYSKTKYQNIIFLAFIQLYASLLAER